jgi:hypothetical protein
MPAFPSEEAAIVALAKNLANGLKSQPGDFPMPPVCAEALLASAQALASARDQELALKGELEAASKARREALEQLVEQTKLNVAYAEQAVDYDDAKLRSLGWKGLKPEKLQPPGPPRVLELVRISDNGVELDWKKPGTGGDAQSYRIEARQEGVERWSLKGFSLHSDCILNNLDPGHTYQVRVIAVNKIGEGEPSQAIEVSA